MAGCINKFDSAPTDVEAMDVGYNITIEQLHATLATRESVDIVSDAAICGVVTANDISGNLYKSFVIEQDGYAVEVLEGLFDTYVRYPVGSVVVVSLRGLRAARSYGILQLGVATFAGSYYALDYLGHEYLVDKHITNTGHTSSVEPYVVSAERLNDEVEMAAMCGRLITVEGLRYQAEDESDDMLWSGTRSFVSGGGDVVQSYTSSYSNFSMCTIPSGELSLSGILQSGGDNLHKYPMIELRGEEDCRVDGD